MNNARYDKTIKQSYERNYTVTIKLPCVDFVCRTFTAKESVETAVLVITEWFKKWGLPEARYKKFLQKWLISAKVDGS